ncbi:uncharacterized protein BDR25DRAFT_358562 [Lindgomyces ingoldianus]|uniref:Uncharacterized protein n=1 Tax=Lindgomyces ingoldianus TaxID=673940 RepID=A0ACB6QLH6_9PLEO|nr:uncharacterized protein BDR25DRAFT_358562 [Lindgomyces ingoldianus]KAF2467438.1 hypothetical protein BDR25DRAFT_358562 [Lindgomyces ingoldianus]
MLEEAKPRSFNHSVVNYGLGIGYSILVLAVGSPTVVSFQADFQSLESMEIPFPFGHNSHFVFPVTLPELYLSLEGRRGFHEHAYGEFSVRNMGAEVTISV